MYGVKPLLRKLAKERKNRALSRNFFRSKVP